MPKIDQIQKLRQETGFGIMECKKALEDAKGDFAKAKEILQKIGAEKAVKKVERETECGLIEAYSHGGRIGVLVEVSCETDFVTKTVDFKELVHDLALQIASMAPKDEKELMASPFIKDETTTIKDLIEFKIGKIGENIKVKRFIRYEL